MDRAELQTVRSVIRTEAKDAQNRLKSNEYRQRQRASLFDPIRREKTKGQSRLIGRIRRLRKLLATAEGELAAHDLTVESSGTVGLLYSVQRKVDERAQKDRMAQRDEVSQLLADAMLLDPKDRKARTRLKAILMRLQAIGR